MKNGIFVILAVFLLISTSVFADDVSIDSSGNVTTGVSTSNGNLEVTGSDEDGIVSTTTGTGKAGVYGGHSSGNYGLLGDDQYGVYGESTSGEAGHFQGDAMVTGDLTVGGALNATVGNTDTVDGKHASDLMEKAVYDVDGNGKPDRADDADTAQEATHADMLDGRHGADLLDKATYDTNADGKVNSAASADDSDMVDGQHASDIISAAADEVRTPINACGYTIAASGSYYVTGNLNATGTCITVTADNVTIDLMGFTLTGDGGSGDYGIYINDASSVEVRNGGLRSFFLGIYAYNSGADNSNTVVNISASENTNSGIYLGTYNNMVSSCSAHSNGLYGIMVKYGSTVINSRAYGNANDGIYAQSGSTLTGNTVYSNQNNGISAGVGSTLSNNTSYDNVGTGIVAAPGSTVAGNTAYSNSFNGINAGNGSTVKGNTIYSNFVGIDAGDNVSIKDNTATLNQYHGITAGSGCRINGNTLSLNNQQQDGTTGQGGLYALDRNVIKDNVLDSNYLNNIYVWGTDNVIEGNTVTGATNGINFNASGNFYAGNRAADNTSDYVNGASQTDGGGNASF